MKFTASRLNSLMRLLEISKLEEFAALLDVATFATLLASYTEEGFNVVFEPQGSMVAGTPLLIYCLYLLPLFAVVFIACPFFYPPDYHYLTSLSLSPSIYIPFRG